MASNSFNPLLGCLGLSVPILAGGKVSTRGSFQWAVSLLAAAHTNWN